MSEKTPTKQFLGNVDWDKASRAGELTKARAEYTEGPPTDTFPGDSPTGTAVILKRLHQEWDSDSIRDLAREIRWLKPPFRPNPRLKTDRQKDFDVTFETRDTELVRTFSQQMDAILNLWNAKLVGAPVQVPVEAVSVWPTCAVPVIAGSVVLVGTSVACTAAVVSEDAVAAPTVFRAVTLTRSVAPTSGSTTT